MQPTSVPDGRRDVDPDRPLRLVAFPFADWRKGQTEGFRTRDQHILEWLSRDERVASLLIVDRPVSLVERVLRRADWHVDGDIVDEMTIRRRRARLTRVAPRVVVLDQSTADVKGPLLHQRGWWFDAFQSRQVQAAIAWGLERSGGADACFAWHPAATSAIEALGLPVVFDSVDNWLIHPAFARWRERSREAYGRLLPAARGVFVSAPASRSVLAEWRGDIEVVPNGVDPEVFKVPRPRPADLPEGPIVGYVGKLARRIDATLVAETAMACPNVQFVFVGPELEPSAIAPMRGLKNVHLLGDRHYRLVPAYVQHFDICWIPHSVGPGETGGDPIKLYEYWAASKPVVSTPIDGMQSWSERLLLIDDASQAAEAIARLLDGRIGLPAPEVPPQRTWEAISDVLLGPLRA